MRVRISDALTGVRHRCYTSITGEGPMPTAKKRINITGDDRSYDALGRLCDKREQSVAGGGLSLIEEALEYQEDLHFSRVADARLAGGEKRIDPDKAWD